MLKVALTGCDETQFWIQLGSIREKIAALTCLLHFGFVEVNLPLLRNIDVEALQEEYTEDFQVG